jgi:uncharacterized coiled-coil protein SlyX
MTASESNLARCYLDFSNRIDELQGQLAEREAALRELCLRVAREFCDYGNRYDIEAIVDRVLAE